MSRLSEDEPGAAPVTVEQADAVAGAQVGERRPRRRVRRLAWLAWPVGLAAAAIVLYVCYLHVSRTEQVSSDGASQALQAWDMLHGNLLLHGWTVEDLSFYTIELPVYMIVEAIRGLSPDALHMVAALIYTLLVLLAALLARGRAKGREGVLRALIAAGIMIAPQLGPGAFILIFQPDHVGTQVPLLAAWLLIDRAPQRWYVPVAVGTILAWAQVADRIAVLNGVVPLAVVCAVRAYQGLVQRREPVISRWFELSLAVAALASVEAASIAVRLIRDHGGYNVLPFNTALATLSSMPDHIWLAVGGVFGLYGADFFGMPLGLAAGLALLHLAGLALAALALWRVISRFFSCDDLIAQVLAVGILIMVGAYLLSAIPVTYYSARYLACVLPGGAVLAGRMLAGPIMKARLVPVLTVLLAGYLAALGYSVTKPPVPAVSQDLASWLAARHLTYGLTGYGLANATTLASNGTVSLRPVTWQGNDVSAGPYEFDRAWYDPLAHDADFVVLLAPPGPLDWIWDSQVRATFGPPEHTYHFAKYVIMTWDKNLLTGLSPSASAG